MLTSKKERILKAVEVLNDPENNLKLADVTKSFYVPYSTLLDRFKGVVARSYVN